MPVFQLSNTSKRFLAVLLLLGALYGSAFRANAFEASPIVPGVVVDYSPASSGKYIGSPSIAVLPNGDYLVSHDEFGPQSTEHKSAVSQIFRSSDKGRTWKKVSTVNGAFWSKLFVHRGAVYLLGTNKHHGNIVIRRSTDDGATWTSPSGSSTGLLADNDQYATGPMPVIEYNGRLWRAMEWRDPPTGWGINYQAGMMSAPVDADLLNAASWTFSNPLPSKRGWNNGDMTAWLEGNAVVSPAGGIVNVLRVQTESPDEKAAIVTLSPDGKTASFDPDTGFVPFPGGGKKFTILYDARSKLYWSLASIVHERHRASNPGSIRNTLALTSSPDLRHWRVNCILLYHPDTAKHGFQYVDWLFDGNDLIAACRTAYDDGAGGAHNHHDANYLTFHRFAGFRTLTMADSVPLPKPGEVRAEVRLETEDFILTGNGFTLAKLDEGVKAASNRSYIWRNLPARFRNGQFTLTGGGRPKKITVQAKRDATLYVATALAQPGIDMAGWQQLPETFRYSDKGNTVMTIFARNLSRDEKIIVPQGNWSGGLVLLPPAAP